MKASFRNCRERLGFSICREQDKTANRMDKKMICLWMAFQWPLDGTIWLYSTMLLLIFHKRIVYQWENAPSRISLLHVIISWGLYVFYLIFHFGFNYFSKERYYSVTHDGVESFLILKECLYALAFSQDMYQVLHHQDSAKTFYI